jgi:hypothetical protein
MALDTAAVIAQLDALIDEAEPRIDRSDVVYGDHLDGAEHEARAMLARMDAAVARVTPTGSTYREQARQIIGREEADARKVAWMLGVVQAVRADFEAGYLSTLRELVHADVFSDFLDMASDLQANDYKDAAAVIAGSVLEEHLRKLADTHDVAATKPDGRPVKADLLNAELTKAGAYDGLVQKQVTAWLDLRNKAAHGRYGEYDKAQVDALIRGVLDFAA